VSTVLGQLQGSTSEPPAAQPSTCGGSIMIDEFVFLSTIYEQEILRELLIKFEETKIPYKTLHKSALTNYKMPLSTYIEIEIYVGDSSFEKAREILGFFYDNEAT
jgi:hypothetical protein